MDTSRIGQFLGLVPKLGNPGENAQNPKNGFADLLFGVMNKRLSTVQPLPPPARVTSLTSTAPLPPTANISEDRATSPAPGSHKREIGKPTQAASQSAHTGRPQPNPADDSDSASARVQSAGTPPEEQAEDSVEVMAEFVDLGAPAEQVETTGDGGDASELPAEDEGNEDAAGESGDESADTTDHPSGEPVPQQADPMTVPAAAVPIQASLATGTDAEDATEEAETELAPDIAKAVGTSGTATPPDDATLDPGDTPNTEAATDVSTETADGSGDVVPGNRDAGPAAGIAATAGAALAAASDPKSSETQAKASAAAAQGERRAEDAAAMFRRNQSTPRQRAAAAGAGATGTTPQAPAANTPSLSSGAPGTLAGNPATIFSPIVPLGFDAGFGAAAGLPGWDLHLGQGAALRRPEFLANLRQHLQNLPLHEQVALSVKRAANDGGGRITLQLSPAELGRIHVKLDIDEEKNVRASVAVERPSTLELLQRDLRALERALQDAGLKTDQHELSLSLQGGDPDAFAQQFGAEGDERGPGGGSEGDADTDADADANMAKAPGIVATGDGLVDVQI